MSRIPHTVLIAVVPLLMSAAPPGETIPLGKYDEAMVIPAGSPVQFQGFGQYYNSARFSGKFVLEGIFVLDCDYCEPGYKDNQIRLSIIPDPAMADRLPHWKKHDNDIAIVITNAASFMRAVSTPAQRRLLLAGKLDEVRGRAAIVVDQYEASLDCDSASYSARFVAIAKPPKLAKVKVNGDFGCGMI
jgi:hypothetical protein